MTNLTSNIENSWLYKLLNFSIPNRFKKVGLLGAVFVFIFLIAYKFIGNDLVIVKDVLRSILLFFLLLASVSREKIEDEFSKHMKFQSCMIAFLFTTIYAILIPLIAIVIDFVLAGNIQADDVNFHEISGFEVLFIILSMQLLCFEAFKRYYCAK